MGIHCADHATPYIHKKLALTSPTSGSRSVGIVRSLTKATEFFFFLPPNIWQMTCIRFTTYILSFENRVKLLHSSGIMSSDRFWGLDYLYLPDIYRKGWGKEITVHNEVLWIEKF
jgi:hypothetical protein